MKTNCPECGKLNPIVKQSITETYSFEYRCECGYFLRTTEWMESDAFKSFNDEIIKDRQKKMMPRCEGCGE